MAHYDKDIDISPEAARALCGELDDVGELTLYRVQQFITAQNDRIAALATALTCLDPENLVALEALAKRPTQPDQDAQTIADVLTALEAVRLDPFPAFGSNSDEHLKRLALFCRQLAPDSAGTRDSGGRK